MCVCVYGVGEVHLSMSVWYMCDFMREGLYIRCVNVYVWMWYVCVCENVLCM